MSRRILHFDLFAGIAGDMAFGALIDAGAPEATIREGLALLGLPGWELQVARRTVSAIDAVDVQVRVAGTGDHGHEHHHRTWADIRALLTGAGLPTGAEGRALAIFERLATAEAKVHGTTPDKVHFHEVGAIDSIVDIVGVALAINLLAPDHITASPVPIGRGLVGTQHGAMPLPAPATAELMVGLPTVAAGIEGELVTPTGAAILATMVDEFTEWPTFAPISVGYGAGDRTLPDRPNLVRVLVGEARATEAIRAVELTANIDDMSPEAHGYLMERLFEAGALDVWFAPIQMKKNRPAVQVSALCDPAMAEAVTSAFMRESSTLGLRAHTVERRCLERQVTTVETPYGSVRVKLAVGAGGASARPAPEHDDCAAAARAAGVPLEVVVRAALRALE